MTTTAENELLQRITARPDIFGGKPIVRDMRIAVDSAQLILQEYPFLEPEDVQACLVFAHRSLAGEQVHEHMPVRATG